ncbi:MAG: ABC transporter ATP-binding protein [Candidatus Aerophobetes bacterium]|nr:ABC transporter ATP-binding protein [Candidatus Aerophobetes bacterium]
MIKIKNVDAYYGNIQALYGISLEIAEGEVVALIGSNGAGKTTTLKAISGLVSVRRGKIEFFNERLDILSPDTIVKKGISHCPEGRKIWPDLTVLENLKMGAYTRRDRSEIKKDLTRIFSQFPILKERKKQLAGTLSGGEQQMLVIGRCLMSRPKLILLDEPSLGLAPLIVVRVAGIIKDINKQGITILLVEQNANLALKIADRGYVLETGKTVLSGNARDLLQNEHVRKAYLGK